MELMVFGKLMPLIIIGLSFIGVVSSYPNSVPNSPDVCSKMIPGHGPRPQTSSAPYVIILNKEEMKGGNNLQIEIRGKSGETFKGFYVQVRDPDGAPIGTFMSPDEKEASAHSCFNQKNNAIHHKNNNVKHSTVVYWKAPENFEGKVKVISTVVKDFETFWSNILAAQPVKVSTFANSSQANSNFAEKRETQTSDNTKTSRILNDPDNFNYNPYSPSNFHFAPDTSSEFLLSQPSESEMLQSSGSGSGSSRERNLFGSSFDFHAGGGLYIPKIPPALPFTPQLVPSPHHLQHHPPQHHPYSIKDIINSNNPDTPTFHQPHRPQIKHHHHGHEDVKPFVPLKRKPKVDDPLLFKSKPLYEAVLNKDLNRKSPVHFPHDNLNELHSHYHHYPPQYGQGLNFPHMMHSVYDVNGNGNNNLLINHHQDQEALRFQHKPATDPSYPGSGYYPKDILTRLTSYIPNIYQTLMKNPWFNVHVDNTLESVWKPSTGLGSGFIGQNSFKTPISTERLPQAQSQSEAQPSKFPEMPKFGYLIYNPSRGDPFYVIPAQNEEEFFTKHIKNYNQ